MRKLAAWAAMIVVALLLVPVIAVMAFAQDAVVITPASPWDDFWRQIQAPLAAFAMAVLTAFGTVVTFYARRWFGDGAALAANQSYKIAMEAAAGWLAAKLLTGREMDDALLSEATDYITGSYPEVSKIEPNLFTVGEDILAAFGRLKGAKG